MAMLPRTVGFVLVILLFPCVNVSSLSNETIWNSLSQLFNKETQKLSQKLVLLLRSHTQPWNPLSRDKKKDEKRILNIEQLLANRLEKVPYEIDKENNALRQESRARRCQRLESCYNSCMFLRTGSNDCRGTCLKAFDSDNDCGTAKIVFDDDDDDGRRRSGMAT